MADQANLVARANSFARYALAYSLGIHAAIVALGAFFLWHLNQVDGERVYTLVLVENASQVRKPELGALPIRRRLVNAKPNATATGLSTAPHGSAASGESTSTSTEVREVGSAVGGSEESAPVDEYLVTAMPKLKHEVKIPYPEEARRARVQGVVRMSLIIDASGSVKESTVISGPGYGLNEAARAASLGFVFESATIEGKKVAVKILYAYRFVLEN